MYVLEGHLAVSPQSLTYPVVFRGRVLGERQGLTRADASRSLISRAAGRTRLEKVPANMYVISRRIGTYILCIRNPDFSRRRSGQGTRPGCEQDDRLRPTTEAAGWPGLYDTRGTRQPGRRGRANSISTCKGNQATERRSPSLEARGGGLDWSADR